MLDVIIYKTYIYLEEENLYGIEYKWITLVLYPSTYGSGKH